MKLRPLFARHATLARKRSLVTAPVRLRVKTKVRAGGGEPPVVVD
jgi:hypothetical protein